MVKISVADTGIGIREEDLPRLFQKFEQLDSGISRKYDGTGLGLAITNSLLICMEGKSGLKVNMVKGVISSFYCPSEGKIALHKLHCSLNLLRTNLS